MTAPAPRVLLAAAVPRGAVIIHPPGSVSFRVVAVHHAHGVAGTVGFLDPEGLMHSVGGAVKVEIVSLP